MHARSCPGYPHVFGSIVIIAFCLLYSATVLASAKDDYNEGVEFFEKGDYHSAIASFKSAEKKGMESAVLFYNLGSAYFKIEQYDASKKYYTRVKAYPDKRALAEFNLGMIAIKQNKNEEALAHFKYAKANSSDKKIVDASKQTIAELTGTGKRWSAYVAGKIGYDDNISVTPDNLALGVDDTFYNVYASTDFVIHGKRKSGWLLDAAFFTIDYSDSDNFDQDFYTVGLKNEHQFSSWDTVTRLKYGNSSFGGDDLQSFYKLDVIGARPLPGNAKIILQYRFDDFTSKNPIYDYLEGWRQRAQIRYSRNKASSNQQVYYEGELNNRGELVTSLYSYEYSPTRHTLGGRYTWKFSDKWYLAGNIAYRTSDFPASSTLERDDTRWTLDVFLDYRIDSTLVLKSNVKYIQNDSSVDIYTYDKTLITLGVSKLF
jgi:tetratricopeptide (TPR) repeat protein